MSLDFIKEKRPENKVYGGLGEIMLRLSSPGFERLLQSPRFEAVFGGSEFNVMASLALQGLKARILTVLPDNSIGQAALRSIRSYGIDSSSVVMKKSSRMGIYFLERGNNQRPSQIIYDRDRSAFTELEDAEIDWNRLFKNCGWFHITGITPALSESMSRLALESVKKARDAGCLVSCDLNYRKKLWQYGKEAPEVMRELASGAHVIIGNEEDCQKSLGMDIGVDPSRGRLDNDTYIEITRKVLELCPDTHLVAITLRESMSASRNIWRACLAQRDRVCFSRSYDITHIVDRVGGGDSFAAGLIYGLSLLPDPEEALNYAVAASCLCHTIEGDISLSTEQEIRALSQGDTSGRIRR